MKKEADITELEKGTKAPSLWDMFLVFSKIGAFTIGGGYAMIPLIRDELVKRGWISDEELPDIIALAQSAPGVLAVKGSIAATIGSALPSFISILLIAMIFTGYQDNPTVIRIFKGIRPVVVSLILVPMINMAKKGNKTWWAWLISAATLFMVAFLGYSPIVAAFAVATIKERKRND